ncbi:MAG TPA: 50S ribosomal protein L18 [Nitrospiria bacterium]|jgi:large subunit ribosomal protein L18|nr:50S ribosomal protein L18 [Nitrospiria bacterium]
MSTDKKILARNRRHHRVRKKIVGTLERPRLSVFRSNSHLYAQVINDLVGKTIASASTSDKELGKKVKSTTIEAAKKVGELVAKRTLACGVKTVVFDRGGYLYHGKVKSLAEAAREAGLIF